MCCWRKAVLRRMPRKRKVVDRAAKLASFAGVGAESDEEADDEDDIERLLQRSRAGSREASNAVEKAKGPHRRIAA